MLRVYLNPNHFTALQIAEIVDKLNENFDSYKITMEDISYSYGCTQEGFVTKEQEFINYQNFFELMKPYNQ